MDTDTTRKCSLWPSSVEEGDIVSIPHVGGQAIPMMDYDLAPYVAKSYVRNCVEYIAAQDLSLNSKVVKQSLTNPVDKFINDTGRVMNHEGLELIDKIVEEYYPNIRKELMHQFAQRKTEDDTFQAMEATVHNLCTLASRSGSQVPFSSVNFGTDISEEGRMITRNILSAQEKGLGNGEIAIFPISIFKMKRGINDAGSPNYDLFKLACKVSSERLFPKQKWGNYVI